MDSVSAAVAAPREGFRAELARRLRPTSRWGLARRLGLVGYLLGYLIWFFTKGMIVDRISVTISVALLMVIVNLGRSRRVWLTLVADLVLYGGMWVAYDETRGVADSVGLPLQVHSVIGIDRVLGLGYQPNVVLQEHFYHPDVVRWYDVVASIVYFSHFVVIVILIAALWVWNRQQWVRLMRRTSTVLLLACIGYVLLPTAPPWMAAGGDPTNKLDALPPLARPAGRGWTHLGMHSFVHAWETGRDWVNRTAAMPSLHGAFALLVVVWLWPHVKRRELRYLMLAYPVSMLLSLVYLAEHYVTDVLAGWAAVGLSFAVWTAVERRLVERREARAAVVPADDASEGAEEPDPAPAFAGSPH
ncbi:MAG: phosphatase PAP2 family protein [Acidimicrobiia bacterium]|nr:phosphatase PAP2 family protein [Acidimicrobiia bacterium]